MSSVVLKYAWTSDPPNPTKDLNIVKNTQNLLKEALQNCQKLKDKNGTFFVLIRKEAHNTASTIQAGPERIRLPEGGLPRITFAVYSFGEDQSNWDLPLQNLQTFFNAHLYTNNAKTKIATADKIQGWNMDLYDRKVKWECEGPLEIFDKLQTDRADLQKYVQSVKSREARNAKGTFKRPLY